MRAARITGPRKIEPVDVPVPPRDGSRVLIKVSCCGICGTDIHFWKHGANMAGEGNLIPGHECAGRVADPGDRADLKEGDPVTVIPLNPCGACAACLSGLPNLCRKALKFGSPGVNAPGAYAEYFSARSDMVRKIPQGLDNTLAAVTEPAAVSLRAVNLAGIIPGESVLVVGGGVIGLLCAAWARTRGAGLIALTEPNDLRREQAKALGYVDEVFDAKDQGELSRMIKASSGGFGAAFETSAAEAGITTAMMALGYGGRLMHLGIMSAPASVMTIIATLKELRQQSVFAYLPYEFDTALECIAGGELPVAPLISREVSLQEVQAAFERLAEGSDADIMVMIRP